MRSCAHKVQTPHGGQNDGKPKTVSLVFFFEKTGNKNRSPTY